MNAATLTQEMLERTGHWRVFEYARKPAPTLRMYIDPEGQPTCTITRMPDGTVKAEGKTAVAQAYRLDEYPWILHCLQQETLEREARTTTAWALIDWKEEGSPLPHVLKETLDRVTELRTSSALIQGRKICGYARCRAKMLKIAREQIFAPDTSALAATYRVHPTDNLLNYNWVRQNQPNIEAMAPQKAHILQFHLRHTAGPRPDQSTLPAREEIVRKVREAVSQSPAEWSLFLTTEPNPPRGAANVQSLRLALRAVAEANRPTSKTEMLRAAIALPHEMFTTDAPAGREINPAWIRVLNQALGPENDPPTDPEDMASHANSTRNRLSEMADALEWHILNGLHWPRTTWPQYLALTDRWHHTMTAAATETPAEIRNLTYKAPTGDFQYRNLTLRPVTSGAELGDLARGLDNCLLAYSSRLLKGNTAVYAVENEHGEAVAATSLVRRKRGDPWTAEQTRRASNEEPYADMQAAAKALEANCNRASP